MNLKFAFAVNKEKQFENKHFGDADYYYIYEISKSEKKFVKKIKNTTEENDKNIHADPKKAKSIVELLKFENTQVVVSKIFGPNIKRIKKHFVCVMLNDKQISDSIIIIQKNMDIIIDKWKKGENRNYINLKYIK
ncbi:MAG: hypothetical protein KAT68_15430 [Bacteroidales bacterium]|nr:hypothetical protein [Bacteroidales bacterium]